MLLLQFISACEKVTSGLATTCMKTSAYSASQVKLILEPSNPLIKSLCEKSLLKINRFNDCHTMSTLHFS